MVLLATLMDLLLEVWPPLPAILATNCYHRVEKHKLVPKRMAGLVKMLYVVSISVSILTFKWLCDCYSYSIGTL